MHTHFESNFTVLPIHTNYHPPLIFGGAFFAQLDLCAAACANRLLYDSDCETAVTHKVLNLDFHIPCYLGDIIFMEADIIKTGKKSIVIDVKAFLENKNSQRELAAEARFVFISIAHTKDVADKPRRLPYKDHGLVVKE